MARLKISDFYPSIIWFLSPFLARRSSGGQYAKEPKKKLIYYYIKMIINLKKYKTNK